MKVDQDPFRICTYGVDNLPFDTIHKLCVQHGLATEAANLLVETPGSRSSKWAIEKAKVGLRKLQLQTGALRPIGPILPFLLPLKYRLSDLAIARLELTDALDYCKRINATRAVQRAILFHELLKRYQADPDLVTDCLTAIGRSYCLWYLNTLQTKAYENIADVQLTSVADTQVAAYFGEYVPQRFVMGEEWPQLSETLPPHFIVRSDYVIPSVQSFGSGSPSYGFLSQACRVLGLSNLLRHQTLTAHGNINKQSKTLLAALIRCQIHCWFPVQLFAVVSVPLHVTLRNLAPHPDQLLPIQQILRYCLEYHIKGKLRTIFWFMQASELLRHGHHIAELCIGMPSDKDFGMLVAALLSPESSLQPAQCLLIRPEELWCSMHAALHPPALSDVPVTITLSDRSTIVAALEEKVEDEAVNSDLLADEVIKPDLEVAHATTGPLSNPPLLQTSPESDVGLPSHQPPAKRSPTVKRAKSDVLIVRPPKFSSPSSLDTDSSYHDDDADFAVVIPRMPFVASMRASAGSARSDPEAIINSPESCVSEKIKAAGAGFTCYGFGECEASFSSASRLVRHVRKHTGERPFSCHCRQMFGRIDKLRRHLKRDHPDTPDKNEETLQRQRELRRSLMSPSHVNQAEPVNYSVDIHNISVDSDGSSCSPIGSAMAALSKESQKPSKAPEMRFVARKRRRPSDLSFTSLSPADDEAPPALDEAPPVKRRKLTSWRAAPSVYKPLPPPLPPRGSYRGYGRRIEPTSDELSS